MQHQSGLLALRISSGGELTPGTRESSITASQLICKASTLVLLEIHI
jgi:hypothetical protein